MKRAFDKVLSQLQAGEDLVAAGVDQLSRRWQASATFIGKLCTETDRWQTALRQIQAPLRQMQKPVNLAEILRTRTIP
ncbi:MAG: hypothetical protein ABJC66_06420 [Gammaproteobacteria bacterium]